MCREAKQELDAVAVSEDSVGADVSLSREVRLEEATKQGRERGCVRAHDSPPGGRTSRTKSWNRVLACSNNAVVIRR